MNKKLQIGYVMPQSPNLFRIPGATPEFVRTSPRNLLKSVTSTVRRHPRRFRSPRVAVMSRLPGIHTSDASKRARPVNRTIVAAVMSTAAEA